MSLWASTSLLYWINYEINEVNSMIFHLCKTGMASKNLAVKATLFAATILASSSTLASTADCVEDGAEDVGAAVERQWEKVEDGLFGEDAEERREEAQERAEDRQEEIAERRRGESCD